MRPHDEEKLIQAAVRGDESALSELYNRYADKIYKYVLYRTSDPPTAEDITADVFLRAIESLEQYDDRGLPFVAWLYRIAHARVVDHWRKAHRRPVLHLDDPLIRDYLQLEFEPGVDVLEHQALIEALRQITDEQQQVIILKFMQGLDNEEIASIMDKTTGAIKALQHRGLEALARILGE